jgi:hypothetical protein
MNNDLLVLLQPLDNVNGNLQHISHDIRRSKCQPLRQRNIGNTICLVDLDESQILCGRSVLDVMA